MAVVFEKVECKVLYFNMQCPWGRNGIVFWVYVFKVDSSSMSSKLEWVTFSTLDSYTGEDVRNACCYTFVVLSALEAFLHLAQVGYQLEFPVMVSLTFHLNQFHFQFRKFFSLFVIFFFFSESLRKGFCWLSGFTKAFCPYCNLPSSQVFLEQNLIGTFGIKSKGTLFKIEDQHKYLWILYIWKI